MTILLGRYPRLLRALELMSTLYQKFYDKVVEFLLTIPGIKTLVLYYFRFLMRFRIVCLDVGERYTQTELSFFGLFLATVASRLKFAGTMITLSLIFASLELQFQNMARFYRKRLTLLDQHFPEGQDPKRNMHRIPRAVMETLSNPTVVAAGTLVTGALGWKALDVWEVTKQEGIADKDRESEAASTREAAKIAVEGEAIARQGDRDAEAIERQKDRDAEDRRLDKQLQAEAIERQKDRDDAYRMHRESLDVEDRRHRESLEVENQKNRETRLSDIDYTKNSTSSTEDFVDSTQIVD